VLDPLLMHAPVSACCYRELTYECDIIMSDESCLQSMQHVLNKKEQKYEKLQAT